MHLQTSVSGNIHSVDIGVPTATPPNLDILDLCSALRLKLVTRQQKIFSYLHWSTLRLPDQADFDI